jgi:hypothetical protein
METKNSPNAPTWTPQLERTKLGTPQLENPNMNTPTYTPQRAQTPSPVQISAFHPLTKTASPPYIHSNANINPLPHHHELQLQLFNFTHTLHFSTLTQRTTKKLEHFSPLTAGVVMAFP